VTSLPKRGDRVRVTEVAWGDTIPESLVGQELTLEFDLEPLHRTPGFLELPVPYSACRPAAVKVEILERAGEYECSRCDWNGAAPRLRDENGVPLCPMCACVARPRSVSASVHPEFARGMRRAVTIAEGLSHRLRLVDGDVRALLSVEALTEAVEEELK
jgi:hypothetical protein